MCGIAGILYSDPSRPVEKRLLQAIGDSIAHRGPDAEGFYTAPGVGLVHRRLSIIDLTQGDQPIGNEDGSVQVVFNGEIYNFEKIRSELAAQGHRFKTKTDTEIIVHLYEEMQERLVERLRGMFAFALWDQKRRLLLLARDRLGIKPLYFCRDAEKIIFGSELKAILAWPGIDRKVDVESLEDYLAFGMVSGQRSIFRGMDKLPPGHVLVVRPETWEQSPTRYWRFSVEPDEQLSVDVWQEAVRAKLDETVRAHLVADVPVGAFLSGGLDSSGVVATASKYVQKPLQTFSIGFEEESFSELPFARQVAKQFGTEHTEQVVTADAVALIDELSRYFDEPFGDSSAIPTYLVARLASQSVKVVLSGDGGDEAFGGYARYAHDLKEAALRRWIPGWVRRGALGPIARVWPKADWLPRPLRAKTLLTNLSLGPGAAYANSLAVCRQPLRRQLLAPDIARQLNGHEPDRIIRESYASALGQDALAGMISADVATVLPDDFLVKVDRASMAHGLEVRPPLLDHELLELVARIPSRYKVRYGQTKWIFKQACQDLLPESLLKRPKHGFEIPVDSWLRGPLQDMFQATVLRPGAIIGDLVNQATAQRLLQRHTRGLGHHGNVLWSLLMLARWSERYLKP